MVRPARDVDRLIDGMLDYGRQFRPQDGYRDDPLDTRRGWGNPLEETPDNLIPYPSRRAGEYTARRAANA